MVENEEKSCWEPKQEVVWLGFKWDTSTGVSMFLRRIGITKGALREVKKAGCIPARQLASITGRIILMGLTVGPMAKLRTRSIYSLLNTRQSWQDLLQIDDNVRDELTFWLSCLWSVVTMCITGNGMR